MFVCYTVTSRLSFLPPSLPPSCPYSMQWHPFPSESSLGRIAPSTSKRLLIQNSLPFLPPALPPPSPPSDSEAAAVNTLSSLPLLPPSLVLVAEVKDEPQTDG